MLADAELSSHTSHDHSRLRGRLWAAGGALLVVALCLAVAEVTREASEPGGRLRLGHDLLPSYTAGLLVREGRPDLLYDSPRFEAVARRVAAEANLAPDAGPTPWLNPPFFAWLFVPLSALPYRTAAVAWLAWSLLLLATSLVLLCRMLGARAGWRTCGLVPLLLVASVPFWQALSHLQNTFLSLAILCTAVTLSRAGRDLAAGAVAGLLLFKPQVAVVVVVALILTTGRRAFVGALFTGAALLLVTLLTMPGSLHDFATRAPGIAHTLQTGHAYNWGRQVTFQGFWRLLLQGHVRGETAAAAQVLAAGCSLAVAAALGAAVWRARGDGSGRDGARRDARGRVLAAAVLCTPLLVPYYMDYDLLLLAVAAVRCAADPEASRPDAPAADCWLARAWVALFAAVTVGPAVASATRLHPAVPLLTATALLSAGRCLRGRGKADTIRPPVREPAALAA